MDENKIFELFKESKVTTTLGVDQPVKYKKESLGKYSITIILSLDDKYLGIKEIAVDKKYMDIEKRKTISNFLDVNEFYKD